MVYYNSVSVCSLVLGVQKGVSLQLRTQHSIALHPTPTDQKTSWAALQLLRSFLRPFLVL